MVVKLAERKGSQLADSMAVMKVAWRVGWSVVGLVAYWAALKVY